MSRAEFIVTYDGPALKTSEMDARDLSPALLAISDLVERANTLLNQNRASAKVVVRGSFRTGSFGIDLGVVHSLYESTINLFNSDQATAAETLIVLAGFAGRYGYGAINTIMRLAGRPIRKVIPSENGKVELVVDDEHIETEQEVLALLRDPEFRNALEKAVYKPLDQDGIDTFAVQKDKDSVPMVVRKQERHWFRAPPDSESEVLSDDISQEFLQLVSVAFREDNKWRVSDGLSTFYVDMEDTEFLRLVDQGDVQFSANDLLYVTLRRRRYLDGRGRMKVEAAIIEVIEHRSGQRQYSLDIPPNDDDS